MAPNAAALELDHAASAARPRYLAVVEPEDASLEVRQLYGVFRERFGRTEVPQILKCFATHPPLLEHMMGLAQPMLFSEGLIGRRNKELIATFVSARNGCDYCTRSHGTYLLDGGAGEQIHEAAVRGDMHCQALTAAQRVMLQVAHKLTVEPSAMQAADMAALHDAGWSDAQIAEIVHITALFACFNRVVSAFGVTAPQCAGPAASGSAS